jgi:hypothetical protein
MGTIKELEELFDLVKEYRESTERQGEQLIYLQKKITGLLYYLTTLEIMAKEQYNELVAVKLGNGVNVTKAIREVDHDYPDYYRLKKIIDAAYKVVDAINSELIFYQSQKKYNFYEK